MNRMLIVSAGLIYKNSDLLITQRTRGKHGSLKWEFPGGKVEPNEDPREALKREVHEELGIEITVGKIEEVIFHRYPERSVLLLFFRCTWVSGEPQALDCNDFAWVEPSSLLEFDFIEADLAFVATLANVGSNARNGG